MSGRIPAVSVLMDVSDGDLFLSDALASLAAQSFGDFEIVLCAHGATPATAAIVRSWETAERRLRVIWCERLPLARAHNRAADAARAPLLARLDADDIAAPDRLGRQVAVFREHPALGLAGSAVQLIDRSGRVLGTIGNPADHDAIKAALPSSCPIVHSSVMMRTAAFRRAGGYREGLNISEDYDLYCRLLESEQAVNLPEPLVRYRIHKGSLTSRKATRMAVANFCVGAATAARRNGEAEPFVNGIPSLRRAAALTPLSRREVRARIASTTARSKVSRWLIAHPALAPLTSRLRRAALAMGLRPVYSFLFDCIGSLRARSAPNRG